MQRDASGAANALGPNGPYESKRKGQVLVKEKKNRARQDKASLQGEKRDLSEELKIRDEATELVRDADLLKQQYRDEGVLDPILPEAAQTPKERPTNLVESEEFEDGDLFEKPASQKLSKVEEVLLGKFPLELFRDFKQFGYEAFLPRTTEDSDDRQEQARNFFAEAPAGPDYIVGPGDELYLVAWGSNSFSVYLSVKKDGTVFLPRVGAIKVAGKTLKDAGDVVLKRLNSSYNGIKMRLSLETARNIPLYVVGEVETPGMYFVPATAGIVNALVQAGGVKKSGSLRRLEIVRANKTAHKVDLYNFLTKGQTASIDLQPHDVILIPVLRDVAAVTGGVRRPAIYELTEDTNLFDILQLSGGLSFSGYAGRLSLERVQQNKERVTKDFVLPPNVQNLTFEEAMKGDLRERLIDGDIVKIFPVLSEIRKTVFLRGHVRRPGAFEWRPGLKVLEVIPNFEILLPEPYTKYIQILRTVPPRDEKQSLFVNLENLLNGDASENLELLERDEVVVFSKAELDLRERVSIAGRVNKPGAYYYFQGMKLRDLLYMAGNLTRDANLATAEIARYSEVGDDFKVERLQVNLKEVISSPPLNNPELMPRDKILIQGVQNFEINNTVQVLGEVKFPGTYSFVPGERISAIIKRAGGYTPRAFLPGAVFTRKAVQAMQQKGLKEQVDRLEAAILQEDVNPTLKFQSSEDRAATMAAAASRNALLENMRNVKASGRMVVNFSELNTFVGNRFDIPLEGGDLIDIPATPSSVNVMGEVYTPTAMIFLPGKTIQYYLEKAGGPTSNGDKESIFLIRADGSVISRQQNRGFLLRNFYSVEVERGDSIFVPKDITRFSWLSATKDITEIIFQIATTTGITIAAFK